MCLYFFDSNPSLLEGRIQKKNSVDSLKEMRIRKFASEISWLKLKIKDPIYNLPIHALIQAWRWVSSSLGKAWQKVLLGFVQFITIHFVLKPWIAEVTAEVEAAKGLDWSIFGPVFVGVALSEGWPYAAFLTLYGTFLPLVALDHGINGQGTWRLG